MKRGTLLLYACAKKAKSMYRSYRILWPKCVRWFHRSVANTLCSFRFFFYRLLQSHHKSIDEDCSSFLRNDNLKKYISINFCCNSILLLIKQHIKGWMGVVVAPQNACSFFNNISNSVSCYFHSTTFSF